MTLKIVKAKPFIYEEIAEVFPAIRDRRVIFAWDDTIFNPDDIMLGPELIAHEEVHCERQNGDPETWWRRYLVDKSFRLVEETHAHVAEYLCIIEGNQPRPIRRRALHHVAGKLASPIYGPMIQKSNARRTIMEHVRNNGIPTSDGQDA